MVTLSERRQEELILTSPISQDRKRKFLENYLDDREKCATLEKLFAEVSSFREVSEKNDVRAVGFNTLLYKGPFVEGSNWLEYRTWEFAVASERHLMRRLEDLMGDSLTRRIVSPTWNELKREIDFLHRELTNAGYSPSLVAVGPVSSELMAEFYKREYLTPRWDLPEEKRTQWLVGYHEEMPIVRLAGERSAVYVADLARLASMIKYDGTEFDIDELTESDAEELLDRQPDLGAQSNGVDDSRDERIRRLQLMVRLRLFESREIELKDKRAAIGSIISEAARKIQPVVTGA